MRTYPIFHVSSWKRHYKTLDLLSTKQTRTGKIIRNRKLKKSIINNYKIESSTIQYNRKELMLEASYRIRPRNLKKILTTLRGLRSTKDFIKKARKEYLKLFALQQAGKITTISNRQSNRQSSGQSVCYNLLQFFLLLCFSQFCFLNVQLSLQRS